MTLALKNIDWSAVPEKYLIYTWENQSLVQKTLPHNLISTKGNGRAECNRRTKEEMARERGYDRKQAMVTAINEWLKNHHLVLIVNEFQSTGTAFISYPSRCRLLCFISDCNFLVEPRALVTGSKHSLL